MLIEREELSHLIPHAGAMCLLEGILVWDEARIVCYTQSHRDPNNPLCREGQLSAVHAVEYGAQAMAVHGGLLARARNEKMLPGYLAAVMDVELHVVRLDEIVEPLNIEAQCLIADGNHLMYALNISAGGKMLVTARATVAQDKSWTPT
jgi:predicted hotdog family 3-hydroxylacyl-ACP dehydratase